MVAHYSVILNSQGKSEEDNNWATQKTVKLHTKFDAFVRQ